MNTPSFDPIRMLQDSFSNVGSIYIDLLLLSVPGLLVNVVIQFLLGVESLPGIVLNLAYLFLAVPILSGAAILLTQRYLSGDKISIGTAIQSAFSRAGNLIGALVLFFLIVVVGTIALILPGIYLSIRLTFVLYAVMLNDRSATDALGYSWQLVKGRWWSVFAAFILIGLMFLIPYGIFAFFTGIAQSETWSGVSGNIFGLVISPIFGLYGVYIYRALEASQTLDRSASAEDAN